MSGRDGRPTVAGSSRCLESFAALPAGRHSVDIVEASATDHDAALQQLCAYRAWAGLKMCWSILRARHSPSVDGGQVSRSARWFKLRWAEVSTLDGQILEKGFSHRLKTDSPGS